MIRIVPDGHENMGLIKNGARVFSIYLDDVLIGLIIDAPRHAYFARRLDGVTTEFTFPSKRQAVSWLKQAVK